MGGVKAGLWFVAILAAIDLMVVLFTMLQIASGVDTPHIHFWDVQIRFITNLLNY